MHDHCRESGTDIRDEIAEAESAALHLACDALAMTPEGLEAQIRVAFEIFGDLKNRADPLDPDACEFIDAWTYHLDGRITAFVAEIADLAQKAFRGKVRIVGDAVAQIGPNGQILRSTGSRSL